MCLRSKQDHVHSKAASLLTRCAAQSPLPRNLSVLAPVSASRYCPAVKPDDQIPSSLATGNAGGNYEQHVGAACLSTLLTGGIALFSADAVLTEVHLQVRHGHFQTDDLLLVAEAPQGTVHRILIQAKRTFSLAASDEECVKTLRAAWDDFTSPDRFNAAHDRLALITGHASSTFTKGMRTLLDTARATLHADEFARRRALNGYISLEARKCHDTVAGILRNYVGENATDERIWAFLRVWDFAVLDFLSPSSIYESLVKNALTAASIQGRSSEAAATWNSLLALVGEGAGHARDLTWASLPDELKNRYREPESAEREATGALREASDVVRKGVCDKLASAVSLPRHGVISDGLAQLNDVDALLITGPAGCGKSVIAAKIYDALTSSGLALAFRADTLATPHLATSAAHVGLQLRSLRRVFALHPRKVLWVESGERLFEKEAHERAAFGDLLQLLSRERGWKIVITCRDHTADKLRSTFFESKGVRSGVLTVPPLADSELDTAMTELSALRVPLGVPALREILRNPFYLKLAAQMSWTEDAPLTVTHRAFRKKAWDEVVCRTVEGTAGHARERDRAMVEIALLRARELTPYVNTHGLPASAVEALCRDALLAPDPNDPTARAAPAHDLYEDWGLLQWVSRQIEQTGGVTAEFFERLGTYPAMRRCFRLWLIEQLDGSFADAQEHVFAVMNNAALQAHWREEVLVAVLQSVSAPTLLNQLAARLVGDRELLRRTVHLLRVSCRSLPDGGSDQSALEPNALVPSGCAWDVMPGIILKASQGLLVSDWFWLLTFLEDWARGAGTQTDPPASRDVARLCNLLLGSSRHIPDSYRETYVESVLRVMLSIPRATDAALRARVETAFAADPRDKTKRKILDLIWSHFSGVVVARELPDLSLQVIEHHLRLNQSEHSEDESNRYQGMDSGDYAAFGLQHLSRYDDHRPASAWQGPFLNLLTYHPEQGAALLVRFINRCCAAYAESGQRYHRCRQIPVVLENGTECQQWANAQLWCLYRATIVGPTALASALMALEAWLLQKGERGDADLRDVFTKLLRESNNVAVTAVLVSVALAYPHLIGEAAMPLIWQLDFFEAEHERLMHDLSDQRQKPVRDTNDPETSRLWQERSESAKLPHRRFNLEFLVVGLQYSSARERVREFLDALRERLSAVEESSNDEVRLWLLRLHRMDVHNFEVAGETEEGHLLVRAGPPSSELQAFRDRDRVEFEERERHMAHFLWGRKVFEGSEPDAYPPDAWREKLTAARGARSPTGDDSLKLVGGAGVVDIAAICIRDHWDELEDEERNWCGTTICTELESLTPPGAMTRGMLALSGGTCPAAQVVSVLLARGSEPSFRVRAKRALCAALFHRDAQLTVSAAYGIGVHLYAADQNQGLALSFAGALVEWAQQEATFRSTHGKRTWAQREAAEEELRARAQVFVEQNLPLDETALFSIDFRRRSGSRVLRPLLEIFRNAHTDPLGLRFHEHLTALLLRVWREPERPVYGRPDEDDDEMQSGLDEHPVTQALARFVLSCSEATARRIVEMLLAALRDHPAQVADFVEQIILAEDRRANPSGGRFWTLWKTIADATAEQVSQSEQQDRARFGRLIRVLLLGISWKPEAYEWRALSGQGGRLLDFFSRLPADPATLRAFSVITARFRSELVPKALPAIQHMLSQLPERAFLDDTTVTTLDALLGDLIYSGTVDVRRKPELRIATLALLDLLVEASSSAAFKLRDDFLTPLRG